MRRYQMEMGCNDTMCSMPLITIIVPVYNVEPYLGKCVDSILNQSYTNLEIILVDDGSPDSCPVICDNYQRADSRVRVIHKINGGLSDARNAALDIMTGNYVGFVDSDDWIAPDMYECLINGILKYGANISMCNVITATQYRYTASSTQKDVVYNPQDALQELFFDRMENYACTKLYDAELWRNVRFPVGKNFEDILTIYKTFERAQRIAVLAEAKYYYRIRSDSISGGRDFKNRLHIYQAICERYREAAPRLPQYRAPLFRRVRNYYCHELSRNVVNDPKNRELHLELLQLLAPFVAENKEDIYEILHVGKLERKKLDAFSQGTVQGCKKALFYHDRIRKREERKKRLRRILKI